MYAGGGDDSDEGMGSGDDSDKGTGGGDDSDEGTGGGDDSDEGTGGEDVLLVMFIRRTNQDLQQPFQVHPLLKVTSLMTVSIGSRMKIKAGNADQSLN